jgi:ABC-2 type transport system permease protein
VVKNILDQFMSQVEVRRIGGQVTVTELLKTGAISPEQAVSVGTANGEAQASAFNNTSSILIINQTAEGNTVKFDVLAILAPGMALMFLMYTVSYGGRSLLFEQTAGTLPRLLVSPTTSAQILAGKMFGIFLSGVAQLAILIGGTGLLFHLDWGDPAALIALVLTATLAATGWGMLLAATFKTPGQMAGIGSALMLIFGLLGGSFTSMSAMPNWVQVLTYITPNRWGLDGFNALAQGGTLIDVMPSLIALVVMALVLFTVSVVIFTRRGIGKQ